ncbi:MAG: hypothetical protein WDN72_09645 [Alphaproteobacteria bacterium]
MTKRRRILVSIPFGLAMLKGFFFELLPFAPPFTRDQVKLLRHDSLVSPARWASPNSTRRPARSAPRCRNCSRVS